MSRLRRLFHLRSCLMIIRLERVWRFTSPLRVSRPWRAAPCGCDLDGLLSYDKKRKRHGEDWRRTSLRASTFPAVVVVVVVVVVDEDCSRASWWWQ